MHQGRTRGNTAKAMGRVPGSDGVPEHLGSSFKRIAEFCSDGPLCHEGPRHAAGEGWRLQ
jgi:hypothetical protein